MNIKQELKAMILQFTVFAISETKLKMYIPKLNEVEHNKVNVSEFFLTVE